MIGRFCSTLLRILLLPLYLSVLGVESWGLVAFYVTLRSFLSLLDFGIAAAFIREIARLSVVHDSAQKQRDLFKTLAVIYWSISAAITLSVFVAAPAIAHNWLRPAQLSYETLEFAIRLMAAAICFQFPLALYQGGLIGLQRQTAANAISVSGGAFQDVGALVVLWWIAPTVTAFLSWHIFSSIVWIGGTVIVLNRFLPAAPVRASFSLSSLGQGWRFAAGATANAAGGALLTHADKLIAVRLLTLQQFGYYAIAQSVGALVIALGSPVQVAAFPRFSQLAAAGDDRLLAHEYERATQLAAVLVFPAAALLIFFGREILTFWTRKPDVAANGAQLLLFFTIGACLSALSTLPSSLQLAYGWFRLILTVSLTVGIACIPVTVLAVMHFGPVGAAFVWMIQNGAILLTVPFMHQRVLIGHGRRWLRDSVVLPALAAAAVPVASRLIFPLSTVNPVLGFCYLACIGVASTAAVAVVTPVVRRDILMRLRRAPKADAPT